MRIIELIAFIVVFFVVAFIAAYGMHVFECRGRWPPPSESKYIVPGGCMVKLGNRWIPERAVRVGP